MAKNKINKETLTVSGRTVFNFKDRIRILFGRTHEFSISIPVEFNSKFFIPGINTTNYSFVHPLFPKKHKGLVQMIDNLIMAPGQQVWYGWTAIGKIKTHSGKLFIMIDEGEYEGKRFEVYEEIKPSDPRYFKF